MKQFQIPLLLVAMAFGAATQAASAPKKSAVPQVKFEDYRLPNGLRVILAPDHSAPVVAISVTYDVGSRNERPGRTGFAHLFEHMMFQGSQNIGKGEHYLLINDNGGSFNGTTNQDRTNYFETLPANQLELGLFMEADRMRSLDISQANLDNQRAVVQEEKRQRVDNVPGAGGFEVALDLAHDNFAYKHTTIGSMADLNAATIEDVRQFFKTYYAPNNAAIAVVGDFKVSDAKAKIKKQFGSIPSQPAPPKLDALEPMLTEERRKTIQEPGVRQTRYTAYYRTVPGDDPDFYPLEVLASVLGGGRTGRFRALAEKETVLFARASAGESRATSLFSVSATLPPNGKVEIVEPALDAEIAKIQAEGPTPEELNRVRVQARVSAVNQLQTALSRANELSADAIYYNDPGRINTELTKLEAVTADDVKRVAKKYLVKTNRAVLIVQPGGRPGARRGPGPDPVDQIEGGDLR